MDMLKWVYCMSIAVLVTLGVVFYNHSQQVAAVLGVL